MNKALVDLLKEFAIICVIVFGIVCILAFCFSMYPEAKKVNCSVAEFSPDMSTEIKQLCREARSKR